MTEMAEIMEMYPYCIDRDFKVSDVGGLLSEKVVRKGGTFLFSE